MIKKCFTSFEILIFCFLVFFVVGGAFFTSNNPLDTNPSISCRAPSAENLLGTDEVGRDVMTRMLYGGRMTVLIGVGAAIISSVLGVILGVVAGYFGGKVDLIINQVIDLSLAFPSLLLAIAISIILPPGAFSVMLAISLTGWASFARLIRSQTLVLKNAEYVLAGKALGSTSGKIIFSHILPNCQNLIIVSFSLKLGSFMLAESGLSFLGLGVPPPYPTLGGMISLGRDYLFTSPWIPLIPGFLIAAIVLTCNMAGDRLEKILDPKRND